MNDHRPFRGPDVHEPANYDESLRGPEANRRFYFVVIVVVGVLTAGSGLYQRAKWSMEDCAALVGTDAACAHGPGTGLLAGGGAMLVISVVGLVLLWRRRR